MPQRMEWLVENRIMLSVVEGEVSADDLRANSLNGIQMSESVTHELPVHIILDGRNITKIPSMGEMLHLQFKKAHNAGWIIVIFSTNRVYKFMGSTFMQLLGGHFRIVETWADAVEILASADPTLPDLTYLPEKMEAM